MCYINRQHLERMPSRQQDQSSKTLSAGSSNPTSTTADSQSSTASKTSTSAGTPASTAAPVSSRSRLLLSRSVTLPCVHVRYHRIASKF